MPSLPLITCLGYSAHFQLEALFLLYLLRRIYSKTRFAAPRGETIAMMSGNIPGLERGVEARASREGLLEDDKEEPSPELALSRPPSLSFSSSPCG